LAKHAGAYRSEKRKKELLRQKKQEEKRQKRQKKNIDSEPDSAVAIQGHEEEKDT
jgi:hypothetical protein